MSLVNQVLICHTTYHRTTFYLIVRETAKCVFVKRVLPIRESVDNDSLLGSSRIVAMNPPETGEKEYRLAKKEDNTFRGSADAHEPQIYRIWDQQPIVERFHD